MKTRKQRKITVMQLKTVALKLRSLERRRRTIATQTIVLRATLKKFILQNGEALEQFSRGTSAGSSELEWAISKIKRGYFYDATLQRLIAIVHVLNVVKWEA